MYRLKYIVTGTGRNGSVFFGKLLTSIGINCGHESIFSYDGLDKAKARLKGLIPFKLSDIARFSTGDNENSWFKKRGIQADSSYMAAPFINDKMFKDTAIIHVVRHPLEVINSFVDSFGYFRDICLQLPTEKNYHQFIYKHAPAILNYKHPLDRAACYYITWNKMIEDKSKGKAYFNFYLNYPRFDKLFDFLGIKPKKFFNNKVNERAKKVYTLYQQIPDEELRDLLIQFHKKYYIKI